MALAELLQGFTNPIHYRLHYRGRYKTSHPVQGEKAAMTGLESHEITAQIWKKCINHTKIQVTIHMTFVFKHLPLQISALRLRIGINRTDVITILDLLYKHFPKIVTIKAA